MTLQQVIDPETFFADAALWQGGIGHEWEGDALLGCEFYVEMIDLLTEFVPEDKLQSFMFKWESAK